MLEHVLDIGGGRVRAWCLLFFCLLVEVVFGDCAYGVDHVGVVGELEDDEVLFLCVLA